MLDNRYCILFIRGARPVLDLKYELMEHPAIRYEAGSQDEECLYQRTGRDRCNVSA